MGHGEHGKHGHLARGVDVLMQSITTGASRSRASIIESLGGMKRGSRLRTCHCILHPSIRLLLMDSRYGSAGNIGEHSTPANAGRVLPKCRTKLQHLPWSTIESHHQESPCAHQLSRPSFVGNIADHHTDTTCQFTSHSAIFSPSAAECATVVIAPVAWTVHAG